MKIDFETVSGEFHAYVDDGFSEHHLKELLSLIAGEENLICVSLEENPVSGVLSRRWVRAKDIKEVYVETDLPKIKLVEEDDKEG